MAKTRTVATVGQGGTQLEKFLTPEAMLTPGAAGGITTLIANTLYANFGLPPAHIGLVLSFLFGLLVMATPKQIWAKMIYYVLNSLIIFCVAFGAGHLVPIPSSQAREHALGAFASPAYAQIAPPGAPTTLSVLRAEYADLDKQYQEAAAQLSNLRSQQDVQAKLTLMEQIQAKKSANLAQQTAVAAEDVHNGPQVHPNSRNDESSKKNPWQNPFRSPCSIFQSPFGSNC
jgi:hypothetical protein